MAEPLLEVPVAIDQLPRAGTAERLEWDRTIRQANELYPDWSSIRIGPARFAREAYEQDYREYYTATGRGKRWRRPNPSPLCPVAGS